MYTHVHMTKILTWPFILFTSRRYYSWSQWSARTFARDSLKAFGLGSVGICGLVMSLDGDQWDGDRIFFILK